MNTEAQTTTETPKVVVPRRKWEHTDRAVVMTEPGGAKSVFPHHTMPDKVRDHLAFLGLSGILSKSEKPDEAYDKLAGGDIKVRAAAKGAEISPWRQALALAMVDDHKKAGIPLTHDEAKTRVAAMSGAEVGGQKTHPGVVKHYNALTGKTKGYSLVPKAPEADPEADANSEAQDHGSRTERKAS